MRKKESDMIGWFKKRFLTPAPVAILPGLPSAPSAPEWTREDMLNWQRFLHGTTGRRLVERLRATEYVLAVTGASDKVYPAHSAGVTIGFNHCFRQMLTLSSVSADSEANNGGTVSEPSANETFEEKMKREEREFISRNSP